MYDKETEKYYVVTAAAIEVSDEEYLQICKAFPDHTDNQTPLSSLDAKAENLLNTVANITLGSCIGGGVTSIVFSLVDGGFDVVLFTVGFWTILSALFSFALAKVLIQISLTLKHK